MNPHRPIPEAFELETRRQVREKLIGKVMENDKQSNHGNNERKIPTRDNAITFKTRVKPGDLGRFLILIAGLMDES
jgi:hypothetical protein